MAKTSSSITLGNVRISLDDCTKAILSGLSAWHTFCFDKINTRTPFFHKKQIKLTLRTLRELSKTNPEAIHYDAYFSFIIGASGFLAQEKNTNYLNRAYNILAHNPDLRLYGEPFISYFTQSVKAMAQLITEEKSLRSTTHSLDTSAESALATQFHQLNEELHKDKVDLLSKFWSNFYRIEPKAIKTGLFLTSKLQPSNLSAETVVSRTKRRILYTIPEDKVPYQLG